MVIKASEEKNILCSNDNLEQATMPSWEPMTTKELYRDLEHRAARLEEEHKRTFKAIQTTMEEQVDLYADGLKNSQSKSRQHMKFTNHRRRRRIRYRL